MLDCDLIITIGTSLKVLKAYKCLWPKGVTIVVVNLQWTPKTKQASLVINQKRSVFWKLTKNKSCFISDIVLSGLLNRLNLTPTEYKMASDQLAELATPMKSDDHAPLTPMAEFVPLSKGDSFPGTRLIVSLIFQLSLKSNRDSITRIKLTTTCLVGTAKA